MSKTKGKVEGSTPAQSEAHAEPPVIKPTKPFTKITASDYVFKATGPVKMGTMNHLGLKLKD